MTKNPLKHSNKKRSTLISTILLAIYFVLAAVLIWSDLNFETFNLWEGINWFVLGIFFLSLPKIIPGKYRRIALSASFALILFGISDFIEIRTGAYWIHRELLVLKILCLAGFVFSLLWFAKVFLKPRFGNSME